MPQYDDFLENYRTVLFAALGFTASDRIVYQNTLVDQTTTPKWINIIVDNVSEIWGSGGDYTWHFNLILETVISGALSIDTNDILTLAVLVGQVVEAHQNRATLDLWNTFGIKIMGVPQVQSVPQSAQEPKQPKKLITVKLYIHNNNSGQPAPALP